ncbi:zinc finger, matrin-type 2 [Gonapodya sp. JEL0774]|nr:zinc finger, matrin-type 2 [Gonapodya sp. JEL0774]
MSHYDKEKKNDTSFRRTWDKEEYAARAKEREKEAKEGDKDDSRKMKGLRPKRVIAPEDRPTALLKPREEKLELDKHLNKTQVVAAQPGAANQPGYYCKTCDIVVKDSVNYLDHINGRKHQRNLGFSMKQERSSLDQVKSRLEALKRKVEEPEVFDFDKRLEEARQQEEDEKRRRKERKKEKRRKKDHDGDGEGDGDEDATAGDAEAEMMAAMGFSGFGSTKK